MKIAALLTCFNRKDKTLSCLNSLFSALESYNNKNKEKINLSVYLTDDGCTDGTPEAINDNFKNRNVHVLKGSGSLFWAGGMRFAWNTAIKSGEAWDFFLLLNDDVVLFTNLFDVLMQTHEYSLRKFNKIGMYSGLTCYTNDHTRRSYGGRVFVNKFLGTDTYLSQADEPQLCDITNANILFVNKSVVDKIGIFWHGYHHAHADYDYAIQARKHGFPVMITATFCGECDYDHESSENTEAKVINMSLKDRKKYFNHPIRSNKDYMHYIRRNFPVRLPFVFLGRMLNLYFPKLYYGLHHMR